MNTQFVLVRAWVKKNFSVLMVGLVMVAVALAQLACGGTTASKQVPVTPWDNADLAAIRAVIEPQIPAWRKAASADTATHHVTVAQAGLAPSLNLSGVDYGYCQNHGFYVIVPMPWHKYDQGYPYRTWAYSYIVGGHRWLDSFPSAEDCAPDAYVLYQHSDAGGGWYLSNVATDKPPTPNITLPPPTPTVNNIGPGAQFLSGLPVLVTFILIVGGITVFLVFYFGRQAKQRAADLQRAAKELGFEFLPFLGKNGGSLLSNRGGFPRSDLGGFPLFSRGISRRQFNLMRGQTGHLAAAIFDYEYSSGGRYSQTCKQTVAAFQMDSPPLPPFSLRPKSVWDKIGAWMGYKDINFPQAPVFSKNYSLRGSDEMALRNLFTDQTLAFFEANQGLNVEAARDWLLVYRFNDLVYPWAIHALLEEGLRVVDQLHPARAES